MGRPLGAYAGKSGPLRVSSDTDWLLKGNAEQLAQRIRDYWKAKGKSVDVYVENMAPAPGSSRITINGPIGFQIRSNMKRGYPV